MTQTAKDTDESENSTTTDKLPSDTGWALGTRLRGKGGSVLHDVWRGSAADLAQMDRLAIFPAKGWWAYRKFPEGDRWHNCHEFPIRYSLLISIEAEQDIPLYNEISIALGST